MPAITIKPVWHQPVMEGMALKTAIATTLAKTAEMLLFLLQVAIGTANNCMQ